MHTYFASLTCATLLDDIVYYRHLQPATHGVGMAAPASSILLLLLVFVTFLPILVLLHFNNACFWRVVERETRGGAAKTGACLLWNVGGVVPTTFGNVYLLAAPYCHLSARLYLHLPPHLTSATSFSPAYLPSDMGIDSVCGRLLGDMVRRRRRSVP